MTSNLRGLVGRFALDDDLTKHDVFKDVLVLKEVELLKDLAQT